MSFGQILDVVLSIIAIFMAIVLHEAAHGYVAARLGDPTARSRGRLTLNPLAHIDPIGTILVPLALAVLRAPFLFGWATPVPINPNYFRNPFRGMLYVALAGPGTNAVLAIATTIVGRLVLTAIPDALLFDVASMAGNLTRAILVLLGMFVIYNVILGAFNMIPIPPLDGSRVLTYFLPARGRRFMLSIERYGLLIMFAIIYLGGGLSLLFRWVSPLLELLLGDRWLLAMALLR